MTAKELIVSILFCIMCAVGNTQSYIGVDNKNFCLVQEARVKFGGTSEYQKQTSFLFGFKTIVRQDPVLKFRAGFELREGIVGTVVYIPLLNLSLKELKYNTPISMEVRCYTKWLLLAGGVELYKDLPYYYVNIFIPFQID